MRPVTKVWIELFLLDNALMGFLILRTAEAFAPCKLKRWPTVASCVVGAAVAALSMQHPFFLSWPVKIMLLAAMTAAFWPRTLRDFAKCAVCVLIATFALGGLFYALCGVFDGSAVSGVLYADTSLRVILVGLCAATFLPRLIRSLNAKKRLLQEAEVTLRANGASVTVTGRLDTGNLLREPLTGLPVVVADQAACEDLFRGDIKIPVAYQTIDATGMMEGVLGTISAPGLEETRCCIARSPGALADCGAVVNAELFALWGGEMS